MNFFTKTKFLLAVIVVLTAIIVAMLGTIGYHYIRFVYHDDARPRDNQQPGVYMAKQLKLTPEQVSEFQMLRDEFHKKLNDLNKEIHSTSKQIMDEIMSDESNKVTLDSLASRFGDLQTQQKELMINHLLEVKSKCTPAQKGNFSKFLRKMENIERARGERVRERERPRQREIKQ